MIEKNEIWKDIPGYEGVYMVSNLGTVKSVARIDLAGRKLKERILSQSLSKDYYVVGLHYNHVNKQMKVHRIVAMAFIPNPNNLPQINHKDENKLNNDVNNLEWCDARYNNNYGTRIERYSVTRSRNSKGIIPHPEMQKQVAMVDVSTDKTLNTFCSLSEAARQCRLRESKISLVCNGKRRTTGGYKWRFV